MYKVYYHCAGALDDAVETKFDVSATFLPLEYSPKSVLSHIYDEVSSKFSLDILRLDSLTFHLCSLEDIPVKDLSVR